MGCLFGRQFEFSKQEMVLQGSVQSFQQRNKLIYNIQECRGKRLGDRRYRRAGNLSKQEVGVL